jgi:hypothetical protein
MDYKEKEKIVKKELGKIYEQLVSNSKKTCRWESEHLREELLHFCIDQFLEKDLDYQMKVVNDGKLENFITRLMGLNLKSSTSPFYYRVRKYTNDSRELLEFFDYKEDKPSIEIEESTNCISGSVSGLDYYEKYLITEHYYKGMNIASISKNTGISPVTIKKDIVKVLKQIKLKCQESYYK